MEDWADDDLRGTLAKQYPGMNAFTLMRLTGSVKELLHPCGIDFSKIDFKKHSDDPTNFLLGHHPDFQSREDRREI